MVFEASVLTEAVLSGVVYDLLKCQVSLTVENLKHRLVGWAISDETIDKLAQEIQLLECEKADSREAVEDKLRKSENIQNILKGNQISQIHYGSGDNIGIQNINKK